MNESSKKNNILGKIKVISILITLIVMVPFVISEYLSLFGLNLKYYLDNLSIYEWICSQPFALTTDGRMWMHSSPRYAFLGNMQEFITASIFMILAVLLYCVINKTLNFIFNRKEMK